MGVLMFWRSGGKGLVNDWLTGGGVCRTDPGLLKKPILYSQIIDSKFFTTFEGKKKRFHNVRLFPDNELCAKWRLTIGYVV